MKNSLIRVLISLFLCCCLVLNVAAMPARASSFGLWLLHQIGTDIGITGILEGLGLFRDSLNGDEYYNDLVSDVKDAAADAGLVSIDFMDVFYQADPLGVSSPLFSVPLTLISFVRNWVFDNGVVVEKDTPTNTSWSFGSSTITSNRAVSFISLSTAQSDGKVVFNYLWADRAYFYMSASYLSTTKRGNWYTCLYGTDTYDPAASTPLSYYQTKYGTTYCGDYDTFIGGTSNKYGGISTSQPISLGVIAPSSTVFNAAYPQWLEHQRELVDGITETVVQIGLGNTQAETESLTQEQIWSGQGTLQIPEQGQTEVTLQDILQGIIQLPGQMVTSIQTALQTFFVPSGNIQAYSLDLKALFPFCIPFDIYDFLAALSADPVPPVFEFDLNLGVATEPMKIDLSNWSDLAAIIRTLELGLFCVGLALKTRELIGG